MDVTRLSGFVKKVGVMNLFGPPTTNTVESCWLLMLVQNSACTFTLKKMSLGMC